MILHVKEMSCMHCVGRIDKTLSEAGIAHKTDLEKKQVEVFGDDADVQLAIEKLDDIGFSCEK